VPTLNRDKKNYRGGENQPIVWEEKGKTCGEIEHLCSGQDRAEIGSWGKDASPASGDKKQTFRSKGKKAVSFTQSIKNEKI